jgi:Peptidase M50B-like
MQNTSKLRRGGAADALDQDQPPAVRLTSSLYSYLGILRCGAHLVVRAEHVPSSAPSFLLQEEHWPLLALLSSHGRRGSGSNHVHSFETWLPPACATRPQRQDLNSSARSPMNTWPECVHEAGHACAHLALGLRVKRIAVTSDGAGAGFRRGTPTKTQTR